jgi:phospholipid/cholesterol/gamma-HCH transport system substrate-binding protein
LQQFQQIMDRANALLNAVDAGQGSIGKLQNDWSAKWSRLPLEMNKLLADYTNAHGSANRIFVDNGELLGEIQTTQKRFDDIMGAFQGGQGTAGKLPEIQKEFDQTMREIAALNTAMQSRSTSVSELQQRLNDLMQRFSGILDKANAGQGSYGQFLVNPQLTEAIAGTSREFSTLMKDMRANPKKFLSLRLQLF